MRLKLRGQTGIVVLAFAVGFGAWLAQGWLASEPHQLRPVKQTGVASLQADIQVGEPHPELRLPDAQGQMHQLAEWRGKRILINFRASWCVPCREEMPLLRDAQTKFGPDGAQIIAVALDSQANVQKWLAQHPSNYPVLVDASDDHASATAWGNPQGWIPYSVLVGRDGRILHYRYGPLDPQTLDRWLQTPPGQAQTILNET